MLINTDKIEHKIHIRSNAKRNDGEFPNTFSEKLVNHTVVFAACAIMKSIASATTPSLLKPLKASLTDIIPIMLKIQTEVKRTYHGT